MARAGAIIQRGSVCYEGPDTLQREILLNVFREVVIDLLDVAHEGIRIP